MSAEAGDATPRSRRTIVGAIVLMTVTVGLVGVALERRERGLVFPAPARQGAERPLSSEANVFRTEASALSVAPDFPPRAGAHGRSWEIYRRIRAYPGAPPRIPHGLTADEYRNTTCNTCHETGGWVARFGAYAPLTPHPEDGSCLQCHVPLAELVGLEPPADGRSVACAQCHVNPDVRPRLFVRSDWRSTAWPTLDLQAMPGSPHRIPHEVRTRSNCLTCHSGPAAIAAIRTDHPERANCRQCHVPAIGDDGAAAWSLGDVTGEEGS